MELLLINHPLDCPVCDKGGECPLQNQAMSNGRTESRFVDVKRTYPKPLPISSEILLDRERCVLCARCTRFSQQVAGDPFIELFERGALEQVAIYEDEPFESYFSGKTTQICPVGALTSAQYRFRARPFDLRSEPSVCEHCASGCAQRTDYRRGKVTRRLAGEDPEVNEEWNCDKGRFAFRYVSANARLDHAAGPPGRRAPVGLLAGGGAAAAAGLQQAREDGGVGVLPGGRLTLEDAYAYAKFARVALGTNDIDARARAHSAEEAGLPAGARRRHRTRAGRGHLRPPQAPPRPCCWPGSSRRRSRRSSSCGCAAGAHPQAPRLRPGAVRHPGGGEALGHGARPTLPGAEAQSLRALADGTWGGPAIEALRTPGAVVLAGERLAEVPGAFSALVALARTTGARVAWIPRRAGERGAVEAGALPTLLPGGRSVADAAGRADVAERWGLDLDAVPPPRAATSPASSPPPATGSSAGCRSAGSTPPTCPTRPCARPRSPAPASS